MTLRRPATVGVHAFAVDDLGGHDGLVLDEDNRHTAADVGRGRVVDHLAAPTVNLDVHLRQAGFRVAPLGGVNDVVAGEDDALVEVHDPALVGPLFDLRRPVVGGRFEPEFQVRHLVDFLLRFRTVLHARQVDADACPAKALHQRFGDPKLVDAVPQAGEILLDGAVFDLAQLGLLDRDHETRPAAGLDGLEHVVRLPEVVFDDRNGPVAQLRRGEADGKPIVLYGIVRASVTDALLAQHVLDLLEFVGKPLRERFFHVHLEHEVSTALQVESEGHGLRTNAAQPVRGGRRQVERDHELALLARRVQALLEDRAGAQLVVGIGHTDQAALVGKLGSENRNAFDLEPLRQVAEKIVAHRPGGVVGADLHSEIGREQVGCRVQATQGNNQGEYQIAPRSDPPGWAAPARAARKAETRHS